MKITKEGIAILERDTHIGKWVEESGRLDHDQNALPRILPHIRKGAVIFDVGAFIGDHTIAYAQKGTVHAFEPYKPSFECLQHNMQNKNVICRNIALSDKVEKLIIDATNDNVGMGQAFEDQNGHYSTTIDVYCKDYGVVPDFIKIDAEGYELKILKGGESTIRTHKPVLVLEVNEYALSQSGTNRTELFEYLDNIGYRYADIYGEPINNLHTQFDIICYGKN